MYTWNVITPEYNIEVQADTFVAEGNIIRFKRDDTNILVVPYTAICVKKNFDVKLTTKINEFIYFI